MEGIGKEDGVDASIIVQNREAVGDQLNKNNHISCLTPNLFTNEQPFESVPNCQPKHVSGVQPKCIPEVALGEQPPFNGGVPPDEPQQLAKVASCEQPPFNGGALPDDEPYQLLPEGALGPPTVKTGFKGKRTCKKYGRYRKWGGDHKINSTLHEVTGDNNMPQQVALESHRLTAPGQKLTKTQIINKFITVTRTYQEVLIQHEVALVENRSLNKKVAKIVQVVECLCSCLTDACQETHSTNSDLVIALRDNTATKNASMLREQQHQSEIAAIEKDTTAILERANRQRNLFTTVIKSKFEKKCASTEKKQTHVVNTITKL